MINISRKHIIMAVIATVVVTTAINFYNIQREKSQQEATARLQEIQQNLAAKNAIKLRLSKAEDQFVNGNYDEALPVMFEMTEYENVQAQHDLSWAYRQGPGVEQDYAKALPWYTRVAEADKDSYSHSASYYVGEIYYKDFGTVKIDREKAIKWFTYASDKGVKEAGQYLIKIQSQDN